VKTPIRPIFSLFALALLAAAPLASDWEPPTEERALKKEIKATVKEYDALSGNQDLIQTRRRRELIRRLGLMKHPESAKALLRIIIYERDVRARVNAMEAVVQVGDVKDVRTMYKTVLKQSKTALPDYLGGALARTTDEEVKAWIIEKPLHNGQPGVQLSAILALGALGYQPAMEPLTEIYQREMAKSRSRNIVFAYETLRAIGRIGGPRARALLLAAAGDEDWRMRLAVADVMLEHCRDEECRAAVAKIMRESQSRLREVAAESIGRNKVAEMVPELVVLMREGNLRGKEAAYESLKNITGEDFEFVPDKWEAWYRKRKNGDEAKADGAEVKAEPEDPKKEDGERMSVVLDPRHKRFNVTFFKYRIMTDRVLFVIDVSGSMMWLDQPPQRIDIARRELERVIQVLDDKTLFNVMTFSSDIHMWQPKEQPATEANKEDCLKWLKNRLLPRGGTNTYGALMQALRDNPQIDTIYFLSDGLPSSGEVEVQEEILVALRDENRFRKVRINTIALVFGRSKYEKAWKYEDPEEMGAFMARVAEESGGRTVLIDRPFFDIDRK